MDSIKSLYSFGVSLTDAFASLDILSALTLTFCVDSKFSSFCVWQWCASMSDSFFELWSGVSVSILMSLSL
jgi:hypothetical protein